VELRGRGTKEKTKKKGGEARPRRPRRWKKKGPWSKILGLEGEVWVKVKNRKIRARMTRIKGTHSKQRPQKKVTTITIPQRESVEQKRGKAWGKTAGEAVRTKVAKANMTLQQKKKKGTLTRSIAVVKHMKQKKKRDQIDHRRRQTTKVKPSSHIREGRDRKTGRSANPKVWLTPPPSVVLVR